MSHEPEYTQPVTPPSSLHVECLLVEAKTALLQEHLDRVQALTHDEQRADALELQCQNLLSALSILKDSMAILEQIVNTKKTHTFDNGNT